MLRIKKYIYDTLQFNNRSKVTYLINTFIIVLILLSVPIDVIESMDDADPQIMRLVLHLDLFMTIVFATEYALRVLSCTANPKYSRPIAGRIKYMLTPLMLIDLFAIAPFFILGMGYLRLFRVFRIFMLMRYTDAIELINTVAEEKKYELMICGAFILMLWVWSSFMIFRVEHPAQPEAFRTITDAFWWSLQTFTTLGYGDLIAKTTPGKVITGMTVVLGLVIFSIITAVLTAGIVQEFQKFTGRNQKPPQV